MAHLSQLQLGPNTEGEKKRIIVYVAIDTPQGKVRLRTLYDNRYQINLINQDIVRRFNLPIHYTLRLRKPIACFLNSNQIIIWDAYNLTVTTSDS